MVFDILSYVAGTATRTLDKYVKKAADGLFKGKGKSKPMSESVAESVGKVHPVTKKSMYESEPKSHYGSKDEGYKKQEYQPAAATYAFLALPLVGAAVWLTLLLDAKKAAQTSAFLSPPSNTLIIILSIFIVFYTIFLIFAFFGKKKSIK